MGGNPPRPSALNCSGSSDSRWHLSADFQSKCDLYLQAQPGMETPLDVLSRAASLVHADDEKHKKMEAKRNHETSPRLQHWTVRVGEERLQFHSLPTAGYHKCLQILLEEDNKRWHIRRSYPFSKTSAISLTPHALPQCDFVTYFLLLSQEMKSF
ncbi:uncharacterized protein LOC144373238 isoform X7 [Ictidomys tridecemlineatus]